MLDKQNSSEAKASWWQAYEALSGMKQRGLFVSPRDEQVLAWLAEKVKGQ